MMIGSAMSVGVLCLIGSGRIDGVDISPGSNPSQQIFFDGGGSPKEE